MKECANIEFKKVEIRNPYPVKEYFYKIHIHNKNDSIHLNDAIEELIKNGRLVQYSQDGGQDNKIGKRS